MNYLINRRRSRLDFHIFLCLLAVAFGAWSLGAPHSASGQESDEADTRTLIVELMKRPADLRPPYSRALATRLSKNGKRPTLLPLLSDESPDVKYGAAELIGLFEKLEDSEIEALLKMLDVRTRNSQKFSIWFAAAKALGARDQAPIAKLRPGLRSKDSVKRLATLISLHFAGSQGAPVAGDVAPFLKDKSTDMRQAALGFYRAIGEAGSPYLEQIVPLLKDEDFHTQYWAARALGAMGEKGAPAAPALIERLQNGVASVRRNAALALGGIGPKAGEPAVQALIKALSDFNVTIREAAADSLGKYGESGRPASGELRKMLDANSAEARIAAARTLAVLDMHVEACLISLSHLITENQYPWAAAETIGMFKAKAKPVVPKLIEALTALDPETRAAAAKSLGQIGDPRGLEPLRQTAKTDDEAWVRESAAEAVKELTKSEGLKEPVSKDDADGGKKEKSSKKPAPKSKKAGLKPNNS